uniref:Uncharacterized protein n=1 Tax=Toxoplasma gondii (strain ATCC 50861 / VEG) TaxID=432359 RepID=A0A0F7VB26_TOXGV|nr:TPA: hypothetical protein BN1205_037110 [Toxoplasma gondii VEG]
MLPSRFFLRFHKCQSQKSLPSSKSRHPLKRFLSLAPCLLACVLLLLALVLPLPPLPLAGVLVPARLSRCFCLFVFLVRCFPGFCGSSRSLFQLGRNQEQRRVKRFAFFLSTEGAKYGRAPAEPHKTAFFVLAPLSPLSLLSLRDLSLLVSLQKSRKFHIFPRWCSPGRRHWLRGRLLWRRPDFHRERIERTQLRNVWERRRKQMEIETNKKRRESWQRENEKPAESLEEAKKKRERDKQSAAEKKKARQRKMAKEQEKTEAEEKGRRRKKVEKRRKTRKRKKKEVEKRRKTRTRKKKKAEKRRKTRKRKKKREKLSKVEKAKRVKNTENNEKDKGEAVEEE